MIPPLHIDPDIRLARTLPGAFYRETDYLEASKMAIFHRTWHYLTDSSQIAEPGTLYPFFLLPGVLDEPLLLTRDQQGQLHCLSNVCTHRGKILIEQATNNRLITCGYHGRCFRLDGTMKSMPGFQDTLDFPSSADHLPRFSVAEWRGLVFVALSPVASLDTILAPINQRLTWQQNLALKAVETGTRDYPIKAHWALYCDNYLEGFHIPFVHPALNQALDFKSYDYELYDYGNLQVGIAKEGEPCFALPPESPDYGRRIFAYYYWIFPNLMFNFYPWGLSLNIVEPQGLDQTVVRFRTYHLEGTTFNWTINQIHQTELEDEAVVESVQQGIQSTSYIAGRYSPSMEKGVHHFHRLVAQFMNEADLDDVPLS